MADADFLDDLDAIADVLSSSSEGSPSRDSKQRKRDRNREWMRRARLRKRSQQSEVHSTVAALEIQREALMKARCLDEAAVQTLLSKRQDTNSKILQYRQLNRAYTEVEKTVGALREENFTLREELRRRRVAEAVVRDLLNELALADQTRHRGLESSDDGFQWFEEIRQQYEPMSLDNVCSLVRESYSEILEYMAIAHDCIPSPHPVFGWNDRRLLDGTWSNFMFDKTFSHHSAFELMRKTWKMSTDALRVRVLQPKSQRLQILQVLNESTLIVARESYFPSEDVNLCTVYVLFWLETPDHGFVIGTRSIDPSSRELRSKYAALGGHLFTKLVYAFQFTPERAGCCVAFGGRVNNVQAVHARNCLMDAILAMLRWEAHCVAPILALAPTP